MYRLSPKKVLSLRYYSPLLQSPFDWDLLLKRYRIIIKIRKLMLSMALRHARFYPWLPLLPLTLGAQALFPSGNPGKLPWEKISMSYALWIWHVINFEIHKDSVRKGQQVLMVDDLLATGGTMATCCKLVESLGGMLSDVPCDRVVLPQRQESTG